MKPSLSPSPRPFRAAFFVCLLAVFRATIAPASAEVIHYGAASSALQAVPPELSSPHSCLHSASILQSAPPELRGDGVSVLAPTGYTSVVDNILTIDYARGGAADPTHAVGGISVTPGLAVTGNTVTLKNGRVSQSLAGGVSANGDATANAVILLGGKTTSAIGGESVNGTASRNTAAVSGGEARSVRGGCSWTQHATENTLAVTGGDVLLATGGESAGGDATRNTVVFTDGRARYAVGGKSKGGEATQNTVTLAGGKVTTSTVGGESKDGDAIQNTVTLAGGATTGSVLGGHSSSGAASKNSVTMTGGRASSSICGGTSDDGDATGNTVTVAGGIVNGIICGGRSKAGHATHNTVTISGGKIGHTIHGGHSGDYFVSEEYRTGSLKKTMSLVTGKYRGDATDNTVTLTGDADLTDTTVLTGGFTGSSGEARKGNTLHIDRWTGVTRAHIAHFENYRFTLPANLADGQSILTTSNSVDLGDAANIRLDFAAAPAALREGFSIHLISVSTDGARDAMTGTLANTRASATVGAISYTFDIALQDPVKAGHKSLTATLRKVVGQ
ncbi:MAG: hypothetical protein LBL72_10810 [Candidatus Accumulibacter sp.]|jgi:hypothetical protein|nr:hypothetical protein [Accumulibacter sp.]